MAVGDPGADAFGNTTILSVSQQQYYINLALSLGASRADIDSFIHNNGVNDLGRIVSALGLSPTAHPSTQPGPTVGTTSISAASVPGVSGQYGGINPGGGAPATYAQPSADMAIASTSPSDGSLRGSISGMAGSSPDVNVSVAGAPTVLPAAGSIPTWAIVLGAAILVLLFMERK